MYEKKSELKVGLLVVAASLALLGLIYFATGGALFKDWRHVELRLEPGDLAPRQGDPVYMNGVEIGSVKHVGFDRETRSGEDLTPADRAWLEAEKELRGAEATDTVREIYVHIVVQLKPEVVLPTDTKGMIQQSITGSRSLSLIPGRLPSNLSDEDTQNRPIRVYQSPTLGRMLTKLGDLTGSATGAVDTANEALEEVKGLVQDVRASVRKGGIEEMLGDVREAAAALKRLIAGLEADVKRVTANVGDASADVKEVAAAANRIAKALEADLPAAVKDVRNLVAKVTLYVDEAAPKVATFLDDVNRTGKNLVKLSEQFAGIGPEAKGVVAELGRDLDEVAGLLVDTGHNLLDASETLRAKPWLLTNEPPPEEIAFENLRQTGVNYVRAMRKMESAAGKLKAILLRDDLDDEAVKRLLERTLSEFERSREAYKAAEARLMELLKEGAAAPPQPPRPPASVNRPR